jgi:hypothetical protein
VGEQIAAVVQGHPEVLASSLRGNDPTTGHPRDEVVLAGDMAAQRAITEHLDVGDPTTHHPLFEPDPDSLDLG